MASRARLPYSSGMRLLQWIRRSPPPVLAPGAEDRSQRVVAQSLRAVSQMCLKVADFLDNRRMQRAGADSQGTFLERLDRPKPRPPEGPPAVR